MMESTTAGKKAKTEPSTSPEKDAPVPSKVRWPSVAMSGGGSYTVLLPDVVEGEDGAASESR
jgi:hypothetical protein